MPSVHPTDLGTHMNDHAPSQGCDTSNMVMVHNLFRHLFTQARPLIHAVPDGDRCQAGVVTSHLREITHALSDHHTTEDNLLWDDLVARAPGCALHVGQMRAQHAAVAVLIEELEGVLPEFEETASADSRRSVLAHFDTIRTLLLLHLGDEEDEILPVASTTLTQAEWDRLGEAGRSKISPDRRFVQLGWILASMSAEDGKEWIRRNLPLPARLVYSTVGRRQFAQERRRLSPPPSLA